jgi:hypothetical protein
MICHGQLVLVLNVLCSMNGIGNMFDDKISDTLLLQGYWMFLPLMQNSVQFSCSFVLDLA